MCVAHGHTKNIVSNDIEPINEKMSETYCFNCKRREQHLGNWYCRIGPKEMLRCAETIYTEDCRFVDEYEYYQEMVHCGHLHEV